jgi:hypothetical protein
MLNKEVVYMSVQSFADSIKNAYNGIAHASHPYFVNPFSGKGKVVREADEMTRQILIPWDSAARVFDAFADGSVSRMLDAQKTMPSATYPGQVLDYLLGLGMYHPAAEKAVRTGKELLAQEEERYCGDQYMATVFEKDMQVSLKAIKHPNGTCVQEEVINLRFSVFGSPHGNRYWANHNSQLYCRIQKCISNFFDSCLPNCFPCESAKGDEVGNRAKYDSKVLDKIEWLLWVGKEQAEASQLDINKISNAFEKAVEECESSEAQRDSRDRWAVVSSLGMLALWAMKRFRDYRIVKATSWVKLL